MSSSLLIILLVVVWLLILLPMVVNTKQPIRRASASFSKTRVLHRGGEKKLKPRRIISPHPAEDNSDSTEDDSVEKDSAAKKKTPQRHFLRKAKRLTVDPAIIAASSFTAETTAEATTEAEDSSTDAEEHKTSTEEIVITPGLLHESLDNYHAEQNPEQVLETTDKATDDTADSADNVSVNSAGEDNASDNSVTSDDSEDSDDGSEEKPMSRLTSSLAEKISDFKKADRNIPEPAPQLTLNADDIAEAERRRGRGGYDPIAAEEAAEKRYKRRRIIFLVLAILLIPMIAAAAVLGGLVWIAPAAWCGVIAFYLAALRSQVRLDNELRQRRLAQMRRARAQRTEYGYQEEQEPADTHFYGQYSLVDIDDGDPLFDHLDTRPFMEEYMATHAEEFSYDEGGYLRDRFGRVRVNASRYPDSAGIGQPEQLGQQQYRYDDAEADYQYDDPYTLGEYSGERSVDYWGEEEAAQDIVRFELPHNDGDYRDVG